MTAHEPILRAFGGGPLEGDRWVRVLYLDEAGIGKVSSDPIVVVAGVIIHADTQWGQIATKLEKLLFDATPFGAKTPRFLHAKDIYHGSGEFPRETWDRERRHNLLDAVGSLVDEYSLPVPWTALDRRQYAREHPDEPQSEHLRTIYTVCAVACFMQAEIYMRQEHATSEVCSIVMEQNQELQKRIPEMIAFLRNPGDEIAKLDPGHEQTVPLKKLIDTPSCQPKTGSSILQLADYCAFAIKRRLQNLAHARRLTNPLAGHLLRYQDANRIYWNPVHMPDRWGFPIKLRRGKFERG